MATTIETEADILEQVVSKDAKALNPQAAQSFLRMRFGPETSKRIRGLLRKNNRGTISGPERASLENYLRVGQLLDLLHARARLSLQRNHHPR